MSSSPSQNGGVGWRVLAIGAAAAFLASEQDRYFIEMVVLCGTIGPFLLFYVFGPILTHKTQSLNADFQFDPVGLDAIEASPEVINPFHKADAELADAGFVLFGAFATTSLGPNATNFIVVYRHPKSWDVAKFLVTIVETPQIRKVATLTVLAAEFTDDTEILTSDNRTDSVFPQSEPPIHPFGFPQVEQISRLIAIHRGLVRRFEAGRTRRDPIGSDPLSYVNRTEHRPFRQYRDWGYFTADETQSVHRPTWKGAVLMTWRLLTRWKQIRRWARLRRAERIIWELQVEGALT